MSYSVLLFGSLVLYLVLLNVIGWAASRRQTETSSDYFLAGRGVSVWPLIISTVATTYTCGTMLTSPGQFFSVGSNFLWVATVSFTSLLMLLFGLKIYRLAKARNYITPGDLMSDFYPSRRVHAVVALVGLLCLLPDMVAQLVALGTTFAALTKGAAPDAASAIPFWAGVLISGGAGLLYMYTGGMRAVIWNTVLQGVFFVGMLVVTAFLTTSEAGGWDKVVTNLTTEFEPLLTIPEGGVLPFYEGYLLFVALFCIPFFWQRMYMAKSAKELAINALSLPLASLIMFISCYVIGVGSLALFAPGEVQPDALMGTLFRVYWKSAGPILLMAAFSAGLSTICGELMTASSIVVRDLGKGADLSDQQQVGRGRIAVIVVMALMTGIALLLEGFPVILLILLGIQLAIVMLPALLGIFLWRRATEDAAFASIAIGTAFYLLDWTGQFAIPILAPELLNDLPPGAFDPIPALGLGPISWGLLSSTLVFVLMCLFNGKDAVSNRRAEFDRVLGES